MTKQFMLRTILTVTTGRLLTEPDGTGNGIGGLYDIINWMTGESPYTHQLPPMLKRCRQELYRLFPELGIGEAALGKLDGWLAWDKSGGNEGIKMWLAEIKIMQPLLRDGYYVPRITQ